MTSDRTIEDSNLTSPSSRLRVPRPNAVKAGASFVIRLSCRSRAKAGGLCFIISSALIVTLMSDVISAEAPNLIGSWKVEISFPNGEQRYVRFDAQSEGKAVLIVADAKSKVWGNARPSEAKWSRAEENAITFSGPVEFMLGNVGRDAGTLTCRGKFETPDLITGDVEFSPLVGDGPSKHGTFKATRADPGKQ